LRQGHLAHAGVRRQAKGLQVFAAKRTGVLQLHDPLAGGLPSVEVPPTDERLVVVVVQQLFIFFCFFMRRRSMKKQKKVKREYVLLAEMLAVFFAHTDTPFFSSSGALQCAPTVF